jgi:hypothetical protein
MVMYRLEASEHGTRLTWEHTGFTGVGGFLMSKLLASIRSKMLRVSLPAVLNALDDDSRARPNL